MEKKDLHQFSFPFHQDGKRLLSSQQGPASKQELTDFFVISDAALITLIVEASMVSGVVERRHAQEYASYVVDRMKEFVRHRVQEAGEPFTDLALEKRPCSSSLPSSPSFA